MITDAALPNLELETLPSFNPRGICRKCLFGRLTTSYQPSPDCGQGPACDDPLHREHLRRCCMRCRYAWAEAVQIPDEPIEPCAPSDLDVASAILQHVDVWYLGARRLCGPVHPDTAGVKYRPCVREPGHDGDHEPDWGKVSAAQRIDAWLGQIVMQ